jgi:hypothetical protein
VVESVVARCLHTSGWVVRFRVRLAQLAPVTERISRKGWSFERPQMLVNAFVNGRAVPFLGRSPMVEVDVTGVRIATVGVVVVTMGVVIALEVHPWSRLRLDSLPARPADFAAVVDNPPTSRQSKSAAGLDPDQTSLIGPHFGLRYGWVEWNTHDLSGGYRAAKKHEFLIVLGDRVSVPVGHDATLTVADAGRTQSLNLRKGVRHADAIPGYYRPRRLVTSSREYKAAGVATAGGHAADVKISVDFYMANVSVEPWIPGFGWAPGGRAWLEVSGVVVDTTVVGHDDALDIVVLSARLITEFATSFTVTVAGASPVTAEPGTAEGLFASARIVFAVPEPFTTGSLVIHPTGMLRLSKREPIPAVWRKGPPAGQLGLAFG